MFESDDGNVMLMPLHLHQTPLAGIFFGISSAIFGTDVAELSLYRVSFHANNPFRAPFRTDPAPTAVFRAVLRLNGTKGAVFDLRSVLARNGVAVRCSMTAFHLHTLFASYL